ncbi:MAG: arylsulfatase [Planctomycetaceae bacterium]
MGMRCFWSVLFVALGCLTANAAERPNIVLIMCDDMGWSDIGCYGGEIRTPNIDRLAAEGMRFTQFYNNAKCTTTRASLITGLYPRRSGRLLKDNMVTIPEVLATAGYYSALSGKWHLGSEAPTRPSDRGFDHYYGLLDGCCNFHNPARPDPEFKGGRVRWFGEDDVRITEFPEDFYTTDAFTDDACETIEGAVKQKQPFFLHVCYTAPHYPLHALEEDIARYRGKYNIGWHELRRRRHERQLAMGLIDSSWELPPPDKEVTPWDEIDNQAYFAELMAVYAAMVDRMDQGIGRILDKLDEHDITDNTVVMFLSDNGGCAEKPGGFDYSRTPGVEEFYTACGPGWAYAQNTPFRRWKQWVHEGGISTPFIVRWPGVVEANSMSNAVGHIIDVLPTCADITGAEYPETHNGHDILPVEGLTLRPLFEGNTRTGHETLYWEWTGNRAIRQGNWKLCWDKTVQAWELYNLPQDRTEMHNLADENPEVVKQLSDMWFAWADETEVEVKP